ncbi:MAG: hypothetical protein AAFR75_09000 [Pseudomonadota bacterium]
MAEQETKADRRGFLKLAGAGVVGGSAAAAAAVAGTTVANASTEEANPDRLYQETEHVKRFYALAREF